MTLLGRQTPLSINAQSELLKNSGLTISSTAVQYQGTWTPTTYTSGTVTNDTVLRSLTDSVPNFYQAAATGTLAVSVYRNLLQIGQPNCPALGNSKPSTFKPSYAGYGTWKKGSVDAFGNFTPNNSQPYVMVDKTYPPENYPTSTATSYIYVDYGKLGYLTSWPDRASWQKTTDNYATVLEPDSGDPIGDYDAYLKNGFIATVARQAYYEFWSDYQTRRINQYNEFVNYFQIAYQYLQQSNGNIATLANSKTFLRGNYSNINDLTTSDISGVSLAFKVFGNDCIRLGKAVDLQNIHRFGIPSVLLKTLQNCNAITDALKLALLYSTLEAIDIENIFNGQYIPTPMQEKKIYNAFTLISGSDLAATKVILNCSTEGLSTLADLLNPKAMFPNSYSSLTLPRYSINTASSKIYDFIYVNGGVNSRIKNWGASYLDGILPSDLVIACGAFMMTMNQIKNIRLMEFEKLSQVVANLEVTNKGLPLLLNTGSSPVNTAAVNEASALLALGSGNSGTYRFCDFLGAMSGYPYRDYYQQCIQLLQNTATKELQVVYEKLLQKSKFNNWALISRGKGLQPSSWSAAYAYTLFTTQTTANSGDTTIKLQLDVSTILTPGTQISFDSAGSTVYTVSSATFDGVLTTVTFSPALGVSMPIESKVYVSENTYDDTVQDLIDAANSEIQQISSINIEGTRRLNHYWSEIGRQLYIEQRAIPYAVPNNENVYLERNRGDFDSFIQLASSNASDTQYCGAGPILESICDTTTVGGQSLIGMLRESRNTQRLGNTTGELDDNITDAVNPQCASAVVSAVNSNGGITQISLTFGGYGYNDQTPPAVVIGPYGGVFGGSGSGATATAIVNAGQVIEIVIDNSGSGYMNPDTNGQYPIYIESPPQPQRLGDATEPGSFAGSPYTGQDPVPDNLIAPDSASYTVAEAIELVTQCNCDCWDM